ncbi:hypothetical protein [Sphingomonas oryzagri]
MDTSDDIETPDDEALTLMRNALQILRETGRYDSMTGGHLRRAIHSMNPSSSPRWSSWWEMPDDAEIHVE